jgi:flagellar M-ring protein FliF
MIRRLTTPYVPAASMAALPAQAGAAHIAHQATQDAGDNGDDEEDRPEPLKIPKRESMIDISQIDGQVRESSIRKVGDVVTSHPEEAMAILRTWLHQPV